MLRKFIQRAVLGYRRECVVLGGVSGSVGASGPALAHPQALLGVGTVPHPAGWGGCARPDLPGRGVGKVGLGGWSGNQVGGSS